MDPQINDVTFEIAAYEAMIKKLNLAKLTNPLDEEIINSQIKRFMDNLKFLRCVDVKKQ